MLSATSWRPATKIARSVLFAWIELPDRAVAMPDAAEDVHARLGIDDVELPVAVADAFRLAQAERPGVRACKDGPLASAHREFRGRLSPGICVRILDVHPFDAMQVAELRGCASPRSRRPTTRGACRRPPAS